MTKNKKNDIYDEILPLVGSPPPRSAILTSKTPIGLWYAKKKKNSQKLIGCTKRIDKLTEETRDLREHIEAPHCLQASEPPSGIDETTPEAALW